MTTLLVPLLAACLAVPAAQSAPAPAKPAPPAAASAAPAPSAKPDTVVVKRDTVFLERRSPRAVEYDREFLESKRDHFARMQRNGFGLLMGGIGAAAGGLTLMIIGINQNIAANEDYNSTDPYGYEESSDEGMGLVMVGYISLLASPALITTGIILNRIGNGRRRSYERMLDDKAANHLRLDVGLNSLRLSYTF